MLARSLLKTSYFVKNAGSMRRLTSSPTYKAKERISVTFVTRGDEKVTVQGKVGDSFLDVAIDNDVDLEGFGACEGTLSCSTCHIVFKPEDFAKLPSKPSDEELDMLDLAFGLSDTSRLGCQVKLTKEMDGIEVVVPEGTSDVRSR